MLIFNGKKYFVPFIGSDKVVGADATPDQVVEGVKFAGAKGVVEEGTLPIHSGAVTPDEIRDEDGNIRFIVPMERSVVNGGVSVVVQADFFGNAEKAHVRKGKAFTSKDGYWAIGEMPIYDSTILTAERNENCDTDDGLGFEVFIGNGIFVDDYVYFTVPTSEVGGASIETCNVYIDVIDTVGNIGVTASTFADGEISVVNIAAKTNGEQTLISNVVCGSVITIVCNNYFSVVWTHGNNQVKGTSSICLTAPRTSGDYLVEIIAYDD